MASTKNKNAGYTTEVHIRLMADEKDQLQKKADELGTTLSQAARRIIFKRIEETRSGPGVMSDKEINFRNMQNIQAIRDTFKKVSSDVGKYVSSYERSLAATNQAGDPAVSTEQTLRIAASIAQNQLKLQDGMNEIIRHFGGSEVHVAAKPQRGTAVGDYLAGEQHSSAAPAKKTEVAPITVQKTEPRETSNKVQPIPQEFKTMLTLTFNGVLVADVETFKEGDYEKIRLQVEVDMYNKGKSTKRIFDAVDFAARYRNVIPHLKAGKEVKINGQFDLDVASYNGVQSTAEGTIDIKTLSFKDIFIVTFIGTLMSDVEKFTESNYEKIRIRLEVDSVRKGKSKKHVFEAVDFASKYRSVIPYLKKGVMVTVNGGLDMGAGTDDQVEGVIDIESLAIHTA